jgi:hypothetical protein
MADQPFWNPSDKDADITLSTSNRQWSGGASVVGSVRSTASLSSGKWYVELTQQATGGSANRHGFATGAHSINDAPGNTATSWCICGNGTIRANGVDGTDYANYTSGDTVNLYIDIDNGRIWYGRNGTPVAGNPAAGTGASHTFTGGTTLYLAGGIDNSGSTRGATLKEIASYSSSPPSGFTAGWGDSGGGPTTYNQSLSATLTATAAIRKTVTKGLSAALSLTATLARIAVFPLHLVANMTAAASIRREIAKGLSAPITATASIVKTVSKSLSATCSFTAAIAKAFPVHISASLTASASITKTIAKSLVASLGLTATMQRVKTAIVHLSASVSLTASLATIRIFQQALSASITLTASMTKTISKRLVATQSMIARPIRWVATLLAATRGDKPNWNQCARCSRKVRPNKLLQQMEYRGPRLIWTGLYVCSSCIDEPQPQGVWPRETGGDPKPVILARPRRD